MPQVGDLFKSNQIHLWIKCKNSLGHIVSSSGISIDPKRVKEIKNVSLPKSKKYIQVLMGKINFIRRFIPDFVKIVRSIHHMLKYNHIFFWNSAAKTAFQQIKYFISLAPALPTLDFAKEFIMYTNATKEAISTILL